MRFVTSKISYWIALALIGVVFAIGYIKHSPIEVIFAVCSAVFWLAQYRLLRGLDKQEADQRKLCKPVGFFLLIVALGMLAVGIWVLFYPYGSLPFNMALCVIAISAGLSVWLCLQMIALWDNSSLAGRFLRLTLASAIASPLALVVVLILNLAPTENTVTITCMTVMLLGGSAFLIALNMIMVSLCGFASTKNSMIKISDMVKSKKLIFTRASILKDVFLVAGKTIISVVSLSFFMFANALYSSGMGVARFVAVKMFRQDKHKQTVSYRRVGIIITIASICYVLYSVRLFFGGKTGVYDMNLALVIALYTFVEFGINIRDAIRLHKSKALEAKALRAISFSSTLICFVLTQTAIMSFAAEGDSSFANALSGVVFGGLAALTGVYVIIDSFLHQKESAS